MSTDHDRQDALPSSPEPDNFTRRAFVPVAATAAGCGYLGLIGYPVYSYLVSPVPFDRAFPDAKVTEMDLPGAEKLPPGSALEFAFGGVKPALLIHLANGAWSALSRTCTHLGCTVAFQAAENRIYCHCHGGVYDPATGKNIGGPPPKPLESYNVVVGETSVKVSKKE